MPTARTALRLNCMMRMRMSVHPSFGPMAVLCPRTYSGPVLVQKDVTDLTGTAKFFVQPKNDQRVDPQAVGRSLRGAPQDRHWMWTSGHNGDIKRSAYGYQPTREAAVAAFAKSWRR
jgi:hypothetical protein